MYCELTRVNFEKTPKTGKYATKVYKEWNEKRGKSKSSGVLLGIMKIKHKSGRDIKQLKK